MTDGIIFGKYFLLGRLAAGGMAEVFLAKTLEAKPGDAILAIKRMLPRLSEDPNFVSMFTDEARIASGLSHPNICRILDQGEIEQQLYLVMEFVHGKDLRVLKRRAQKRNETIPPRVVAFIVAKIAEALDYAHHKTNAAGQPENIVHRDVSPQNILLSYDGVPKLIDFGIAKAKDRLVQTRVGVVKGKFAYMSPEQATGQEIDARTDVFALGVVLYELLSGELPFKGQSDLSTLKRIARAEYPPLQSLNASIPARLVAVVDRALRRDRQERYSSAAELAGDLYRHLADERRELSEAVLSSYMRRLFRDDYIREMTRIREFQAAVPAVSTFPGLDRPAPAPEARLTTAEQPPSPAPEPTTVSPSLFLAAGYDGPPSSPEAQVAARGEVSAPTASATSEPPAERTEGSGRLRIDTSEVDDALVVLAEESVAGIPPEEFDDGAQRVDTLDGDEGPQWDDGPTTDRLRRPTLDTSSEPELRHAADGGDRQTGPTHPVASALPESTRHGSTQSVVTHPEQELLETSTEALAADLVVELEKVNERAEPEAKDRREATTTTPGSDALANTFDEEAPTEAFSGNEIRSLLAKGNSGAGARGLAELVDHTPPPSDPGGGGRAESESQSGKARLARAQAATVALPPSGSGTVRPSEFDDPLSGNLVADAVRMEGDGTTTTSSQLEVELEEAPVTAGNAAAAPPAPSPRRETTPRPLRPVPARRRLLTGNELLILLLTAMLGLGAVIGAHFMAARMPLAASPPQSHPTPLP